MNNIQELLINEPKQQISNLPQSIIEYYQPYRQPQKYPKLIQVLNNEIFDIGSRFKIINLLGTGAYGMVAAVQDLMLKNQYYAIKKIIKVFEHKVYAIRTLRELKIMRLLDHENVINYQIQQYFQKILGIRHILLPPSREEFEDLYIHLILIYCFNYRYVIEDFMEADLGQIIRSQQQLSIQHIKYLLYQILRGVQYIHSANILHRDLKPRNILVNQKCQIKIGDFGLARANIPELNKYNFGKMTEYVSTRWYRAPELLLNVQQCYYDESVDIWSIGCILAELLLRKPFLNGVDTRNQLELIFDLIGTPQPEEIKKIAGQEGVQFVKLSRKRAGEDFSQVFQGAPPNCIDLVQQMLKFNPQERISIDQALKHNFLEEFYVKQDEKLAEHKSSYIEFEFEAFPNLTLQQIKDLIYEEILLYNSQSFRENFLKKKQQGISVQKHIFENENQFQNQQQQLQQNYDYKQQLQQMIEEEIKNDEVIEEDVIENNINNNQQSLIMDSK